MKILHKLFAVRGGAVNVDWVILALAIVGLGVVVLSSVSTQFTPVLPEEPPAHSERIVP